MSNINTDSNTNTNNVSNLLNVNLSNSLYHYNTQNNLHFLIKLDMDIYLLWFIFRKLPLVQFERSCKYKYEWIISDNDEVFIIRDLNSKKSLLNISKWGLYTNSTNPDKIKTFLDTIIYYIMFYKNIHLYTSVTPNSSNDEDESSQFFVSEYNIYSRSLQIWWRFLCEL